jgi:ribosomal protein S18 acetylase RimI-like enzyme
MPDPVIRRAAPADAETLAAIGAATFTETFGHLYPAEHLATFIAEAYDVGRTRADLADPAKASWLVDAGPETIGYASVGGCALPHPEVTPACGELKRIYLKGAWQQSGLGARLYAEALAWLERGGPRTIWLGVWSENLKAQKFYARHGFTKVGEYGFHVGDTVDREFILRRDPVNSSVPTTKSAQAERNPA